LKSSIPSNHAGGKYGLDDKDPVAYKERVFYCPTQEKEIPMKKSIILWTLCSVLSGCATINPMAFDKASSTVDVSSKSVLLMTLDFSRLDKNRYFTPDYFFINYEKPNAKSMADRQIFDVTPEDRNIAFTC
jgi:hypothetical protein